MLDNMEAPEMLYATAKYRYELVSQWARLPKGMVICLALGGLAVDLQDRVYILTGSGHLAI